MLAYDDYFSDNGVIRWLPYVMYFQPPDHRSSVVNTDSRGFRFSTRGDEAISVDDAEQRGTVNIVAGSSTVFGIGASSDAATLPSRLNFHRPAWSDPWINMGGRSHNSAQELILHVLLRHHFPKVGRIVLLSGFNDLGLARLPAPLRFESGGFFSSTTFFDRLDGPLAAGHRFRHRPRPEGPRIRGPTDEEQPFDVDQQLHYAADLVLRHLDVWRALTQDAGIELTYVLQPLAGWVRERACREEEVLFAHLDRRGRFGEMYGDILGSDVGQAYADLLRDGCQRMGVGFTDLTPLVTAALEPTDWMFVDRIHFTDFGYDLAARLLLDHVLR